MLWKKASQHVKVSRLRRQRTAMCKKTRRVLAQGSDEIKRENREICNRTLRATQDSRGILSSPFHSLAPATSFLVLRLDMRWKEYPTHRSQKVGIGRQSRVSLNRGLMRRYHRLWDLYID